MWGEKKPFRKQIIHILKKNYILTTKTVYREQNNRAKSYNKKLGFQNQRTQNQNPKKKKKKCKETNNETQNNTIKITMYTFNIKYIPSTKKTKNHYSKAWTSEIRGKNKKSKLTITKNMKQTKPNRNFHLKLLPSPSPEKREKFVFPKIRVRP